MHAAVGDKRETLAELCRRFHVRRLEVFGSAARDEDFNPSRSDADFLVEFEPEDVIMRKIQRPRGGFCS